MCDYQVKKGLETFQTEKPTLHLVYSQAKWPISMNFENIWAWNTVCVIISYLPLFGVLELGELEYPFFLVHRGTWPSANEI